MSYNAPDPSDARRKWDRAEYERLAQERLQLEKEEQEAEESGGVGPSRRHADPSQRREILKPRDYKIDLDSRLNKSVVINKNAPGGAEAGGYYCNVCDCVVKDSINFLDHINGKKHQRNLGMSMKVKRATVEDVKLRLQAKKLQKEEKKEYDWDERMRELQEEETKMQEYKKVKRQEKKLKRRVQMSSDDSVADFGGGEQPEMAALMGFAGFNTSKKPK